MLSNDFASRRKQRSKAHCVAGKSLTVSGSVDLEGRVVITPGSSCTAPQCKAEYRQGFTRCSDCDVELVYDYAEAVRHPLAKKVEVGTNTVRGCGMEAILIFI